MKLNDKFYFGNLKIFSYSTGHQVHLFNYSFPEKLHRLDDEGQDLDQLIQNVLSKWERTF